MVGSKKDIRFYSGDIREYQVDTDNMNIQEKITRLKELDEIGIKARKRKSKRFSWLILPILYGLFHFSIGLFVCGNMNFLLKLLVVFFMVSLMSLIFVPIVSPGKLEKKNIWKKWVMVGIISLAYMMLPPTRYVWFSAALFMIFMLLFVAIIYISLAKQGFSDILDYVNQEQQRLHNEIATEIDRKPLTPIKLKYDIVLGKGEIPLIETDAILLEVKERQISPTGAMASHYLSTYTNAIFGNVDFMNKSVSENIQNIKENIKNTTLQNSGRIYKNVANNYNYGNVKNEKFQPSKSEFLGKFILTQKRILFVGCPRGFQIFNGDIIAYGIDPNNNRNITFQSEKSIRVLSTDDNYWIKRYLDRIMRDGQSGKV